MRPRNLSKRERVTQAVQRHAVRTVYVRQNPLDIPLGPAKIASTWAVASLVRCAATHQSLGTATAKNIERCAISARKFETKNAALKAASSWSDIKCQPMASIARRSALSSFGKQCR